MKEDMKIYFAHSIFDIHSQYEEKCIEKIKEEFGHDVDIVNTKAMLSRSDRLDLGKISGKKFDGVASKFEYFIDTCDIIVCAKTWNNIAFRCRYSPDVFREIEYARKTGKKIFEFGDD